MDTFTEPVYLQTNRLHLHAVLAGPPNGRPVILLHGFPETWRSWNNQIGPLAQAGLRLLAPDQRGYGLSDKPAGLDAYRLEELGRDVLGLMDELGRERVSLVGHDWGGIVAWAVAALFPERVERLAVINAPYPAAAVRAARRDPSQLLRSLYILFFQLPGLPEAVLRNNNWQILAEGLIRSSRAGAFSPQELDLYREAWWRRGAITAMLNWYRALLRRPPRLPARPQIAAPTLILWGKKDAALSPAAAEASLELCPRGRLIFFEQATHWVQHEEVEAVNRLLIEFLLAEKPLAG